MRFGSILSTVGSLLVIFLVVYFFPWRNVNWGSLGVRPDNTVIVTGYADTDQKNQVMVFSASVYAINPDKNEAQKQVNTTISNITTAVKNFGVPEGNIKTTSLSLYKIEDYYNGNTPFAGQWRADNTVEVRLENADPDRSSRLTEILTSNGATNVYGPNSYVGDVKEIQKDLLEAAINDARDKADRIAKSSGKKLGSVISVQEGGDSGYGYPMYSMMDRGMGGGGGGAPIEPGSTKVSQTVVVTFELK